MRTYVRMVVCVHLPRFQLAVAAGDEASQARGLAREALSGRALALAPELGGTGRSTGASASSRTRASVRAQGGGAAAHVGEVSGAAEACGVRGGMLLGEALARCPELVLVPPDPVGVAETWERLLAALE